MIYKARNPKAPLLILILISMLSSFVNFDSYKGLAYFSILLFVFYISILFTTYEFKINEDELNYQVKIFGFVIIQKKISSANINQVVFKRYGWATKGAIVRLHKGLNLRIIQFNPKDVMQQLESFAITHNVSLIKSKDYLILEKMRRD